MDIICYRRAGHNEGDEPRFTQPLMYKQIDKHPSSMQIYREKLIKEGIVTPESIKKMEEFILEEFNKSFKLSATYAPNKADWFSSYWKGFKSAEQLSKIRATGWSLMLSF